MGSKQKNIILYNYCHSVYYSHIKPTPWVLFTMSLLYQSGITFPHPEIYIILVDILTIPHI